MKQLFCVFLLLLVFFSCKKKEEVPVSQFKLNAVLSDNTVVLTWSAVTTGGVQNIKIYRSNEPIPDPTPDEPISDALLLTTISDKSVTTFTDTDIELGETGYLFYRAVIVLADRIIPSNKAEVNMNGFSLELENQNFGNLNVVPFPQANLLYILKFGDNKLDVVDYSQHTIIGSLSGVNIGSLRLCPVMNQGNPELFIYNGYSIICYEARTLAIKYSIPAAGLGNVYDFKVNNGFLYTLYYNSGMTINTYNLSSGALINQRGVNPYNQAGSDQRIYVGSATNKLYYKYIEYYYNPQVGYVYSKRIKSYNLSGGIPADSTVHAIASMNTDSLTSNGLSTFGGIEVSPDGKYVNCNASGNIYSFLNGYGHQIATGGNPNPSAVFSQEGTYVIGKSGTGGSLSATTDVFMLPGFINKGEIKNMLNSSLQFTFFDDVFIDNDTVINCNVLFNNNQNTTKMTVLFNRIGQ
jgi:hypothetical protein